MGKKIEIDSQSLGFAFAAVGFSWWVLGLGWHGMMGQPTIMGMMYSNFSYANPMYSTVVLAVFVVGGYIHGEILARLYNWWLKKK